MQENEPAAQIAAEHNIEEMFGAYGMERTNQSDGLVDSEWNEKERISWRYVRCWFGSVLNDRVCKQFITWLGGEVSWVL